MDKKVAILYDENNQIADIFTYQKIIIYEKENNWKEKNTLIEKNVETNSNIRNNINWMINTLNYYQVKVIIARIIIGIPYYLLDKSGFILCETDTFSWELLEQIEEDYFQEKEETELIENRDVPKRPMPLDYEGNYFLNFALLQKVHPEISSKKALLPFFSNELFHSVTIVCTHIMPWLDSYLEQRNLKMDAKRDEGLYTLKISHPLCSEN